MEHLYKGPSNLAASHAALWNWNCNIALTKYLCKERDAHENGLYRLFIFYPMASFQCFSVLVFQVEIHEGHIVIPSRSGQTLFSMLSRQVKALCLLNCAKTQAWISHGNESTG